MKFTLKTSGMPGVRTALLLLCTAAITAAPASLLAQAPDTPPAGQQGPPPDGGPGGYRRGGPGMEQRQVEMLTKQLNLTPDQVTKLKAIDDDSRQQMMALRDDTSTPRDQKRAKMESIHQAQQSKIKAMLTSDQSAKYDAMQARMRERREERQEHQEGAGAPPPPQL